MIPFYFFCWFPNLHVSVVLTVNWGGYYNMFVGAEVEVKLLSICPSSFNGAQHLMMANLFLLCSLWTLLDTVVHLLVLKM